jgi:uncharacterized protein with GYD domain
MPLFVVLGNFTQKRMAKIRDMETQVKAGVKLFESLGIEIKSLVFTLGRYDMVGICDAPDQETITKALLSWGSEGYIRTETLPGFTSQELIKLTKEI